MGYYDMEEPTYTVDVLGTPYSVYTDAPMEEDPLLEGCDGYCDWTVRRIVILEKTKDEEHADFEMRKRVSLRHEIIHAFLYESGIDENSTWDIEGQAHPEQMVQWIARQFPKLQEAFRKVNAI